MVSITCPANDTSGICALMDGAGAGLGVFIQYMATALPPLLIILAIVGVIAVVGGAIGSLIGSKITEK